MTRTCQKLLERLQDELRGCAGDLRRADASDGVALAEAELRLRDAVEQVRRARLCIAEAKRQGVTA